MANSFELYVEACKIIKDFQDEYWRKNFYMQIVTTMFYELLKDKTSPLISQFCADNDINFQGKNFNVAPVQKSYRQTGSISVDAYIITYGLSVAFSENLDTCLTVYDEQSFKNYIFGDKTVNENYKQEIYKSLNTTDNCMQNFLPVERVVENIVEKPVEKDVDPSTKNLLTELNDIAKNRLADDEKITDEAKKIQIYLQDELATIQQSLKTIAEIRDGIEYRDLKEPIYQLIQLHRKVSDGLKRHPMENMAEGYTRLIKQFNRVLTYITQSLKMLGVELINVTGGIFDPMKNKISEYEDDPLDSVVKEIIRPGFIYKGTVLEQAEVKVEKKSDSSLNVLTWKKNNFYGR